MRSATISASATRIWHGSRRWIDDCGYAGPQLGQGLVFEPGVVAQPAGGAPAGMRQPDTLRREVAPARNRLGHRAHSGARKVAADRVAAGEKSQLDGREKGAQP